MSADIIPFEPRGAAVKAPSFASGDAAIIVLPVVRIERVEPGTQAYADFWNDIPSDSAPPFLAPDEDPA